MTIDTQALALTALLMIYVAGVLVVLGVTLREIAHHKQEDDQWVPKGSKWQFLYLVFGWPIWFISDLINEMLAKVKFK